MACSILAGCSGTPQADPRAVTTTTSRFTHAQVLGWITPTLSNGVSLLATVPPGSTPTQLAAASQPLSTAAGVSLGELGEITWRGPLSKKEKMLVKALTVLETQTTESPGPHYLQRVDADVRSAMRAMKDLQRSVSG